MTVLAEVAERVERGAALLDEREPGWATRIDLGKFDIGSQCRCTLGQLFGDFSEGADRVFGFGHGNGVADHGFMWEDGDEDGEVSEIAALNDEWRRVIAERLAGAA